MQELMFAGAASGCPKHSAPASLNHFRLTGSDVMHWQPKSRLQQLWERLVQVITQEGNP